MEVVSAGRSHLVLHQATIESPVLLKLLMCDSSGPLPRAFTFNLKPENSSIRPVSSVDFEGLYVGFWFESMACVVKPCPKLRKAGTLNEDREAMPQGHTHRLEDLSHPA